MKTLATKLTKLKSGFSKFFNNYLNEILVFAVTSVAAFLIFVFFDLENSLEKDSLRRENSEPMIENIMLEYKDKQRILLMDRQRIYMEELERFRKAILEGNYTQNENTKQKQSKVVGVPKVGSLGI